MSRLRSTIKAIAERALVWSGGAWLSRRRMSGRVLVLAYHNVVPDDTPIVGDRANHLRLSTFVAQIGALQKTHDIVPLTETLTPSRGAGRPRVAITFDDAYRGAVVHAIAALTRLGLPATIFVAPAFIGGHSFWWDSLASTSGGLDVTVRSKALDELRGQDMAIRAWAQGAGVPVIDPPAVQCAATADELAYAANQPGITLGSHTWSHPNLSTLGVSELEAELANPMAWLRARMPNFIRWIAYPYGKFDVSVERAAAAAGYEAGLAVSGGWFPSAPSNRFSLPRVNIPPGMSQYGFELRGSGLLAT